MSTAYTAFLDYVMIDVPGASQEVVIPEIRNSVIEFCEGSRLWENDSTPINVVADTATYAITQPAGTTIAEVLEVDFLGNPDPLEPASKKDLDALYPGWRSGQYIFNEAYPTRYFLDASQDNITLVRTPTASITGGLIVSSCLKPTRASTDCPDWILENWIDAIVAGAKFRLFAMQKKPWSNPAGASAYKSLFDEGVADAFEQWSRTNTRVPRRTRPVFGLR